MPLSNKGKHLLHVAALFTVIYVFVSVSVGAISYKKKCTIDYLPFNIFTAVLRYITLISFPLSIGHLIGLVFYDIFPRKQELHCSPLVAPFLCIRVVTKGLYPDLVKRTVGENLRICESMNLDRYYIEIVTDRVIGMNHARVRELVVPSDYTTKNNSLFKARALQYALEDEVNGLNKGDWILHLDEESILTDEALCGVLKYCSSPNSPPIAQGLITYANSHVVNWITTLADSFRVGTDLGLLRFCLKVLKMPLFCFKGSFVVTRAEVEREIGFDNGFNGSLAEDVYFAMVAISKGYKFGWVEGYICEKSPFSFLDFMQQRKRWIQGILLTVHDKKLPFIVRLPLGISLYSWLTLPLSSLNIFFAVFFPPTRIFILDIILGFIGAVNFYLYIIGAVKSLNAQKLGFFKFSLCIIGSVCCISFVVFCENIAVIWALFGNKKTFYIVEKRYYMIV